jgi:hypothetical protein
MGARTHAIARRAWQWCCSPAARRRSDSGASISIFEERSLGVTGRFRSVLLAGALAAAVAAPALADGSLLGTIAGRVKDESGGALPGTTVSVVNEQKGVQRDGVTDSGGAFTFPLLEPGNYTVRATLSGFQSFEATHNVVTADKTTQVPIVLRLATAQETVTVTGDVPLVDPTNTSDTTHVRAELTDKIPVVRGYQSVIEFAPGINDADADGNTNSHGAPDSANQFLFDGVDTTDPTTGTFCVNVITKSGTNNLHGSARVLVTNDDWNADNKGTNPINGNSFNRTKLDENVYDYLFTLGGPVWKDHVWFFGGYERNPQATPEQQTVTVPGVEGTGQSFTQSRLYRAWQGKLTGQITPSHALTAQFQSDPFDGIVRDYWGGAAELRALTAQSQSTDCGWHCIWQGRYSGVFGAAISVEAAYAQQRGGLSIGQFAAGAGSPYYSLTDQVAYNGSPYEGSVERPRNQANGALNLYTTLFGHSHQFKVGVDYQDIESVSSYHYPNGESFILVGGTFDPVTQTPSFQPGDLHFVQSSLAASVSTGKIWGIYALDRFEATDRLSFNLGLRVDKQTAKSDLARSVIDATTYSPRATGSFDILGNGKTVASAGYGRYYDFVAQSLVDSLYSGVPQLGAGDYFVWDGSEFVFAQNVPGGNNAIVNKDLDPSYLDEFNLALQQQIGNTMAVGIRGIYRNWSDIVDDVKFVDEDGTVQLPPDNFSNDVIKRKYRALELTFEKRFSSNWQALASYTLSKTEGNTDRSYALTAFTSQLLDFPDRTCTVPAQGGRPDVTGPCPQILGHNQFGPLPWDSTHLFKLYTAYTIPLSIVNITAAPVFRYFTGLPYQTQRNFVIGDTNRTGLYYDEPRGSHRLDNWYQLDFSLEAAFKVFGPIEVAVKGDVFNLTNQQPAIYTGFIQQVPGDNFGQPTSRSALNPPRAFQLSGLVRF